MTYVFGKRVKTRATASGLSLRIKVFRVHYPVLTTKNFEKLPENISKRVKLHRKHFRFFLSKCNLTLTNKSQFQDLGETSLHLAISREIGDGSSLHIVDFLVQNGGSQLLDKPNSQGMTALHLCAATDRTEPMKLLLKAGADSTIKDASGRTALQIARQYGHLGCLELVCLIYVTYCGVWGLEG